MRIWLSTAPLAFRLKGAGGGAVDNRNQQQGLHLRNPKTCPNKPSHLSAGRIPMYYRTHDLFIFQ
jgi:hypothetical protein